MFRNLFFLGRERCREKPREEETTSWTQSSNLLKDKEEAICITCINALLTCTALKVADLKEEFFNL